MVGAANANCPVFDHQTVVRAFPKWEHGQNRIITIQKMSKRRLLHPRTGLEVFGVLPLLRLTPKFQTPMCPIFLCEGKHSGPHRGFGARHILAEHRLEIERHICEANCADDLHMVALYVAKLLLPRTPLFYEAQSYRHTRVSAVRINTGTCVLQFEDGHEPYWHVITAFERRQGRGKRVAWI